MVPKHPSIKIFCKGGMAAASQKPSKPKMEARTVKAAAAQTGRLRAVRRQAL